MSGFLSFLLVAVVAAMFGLIWASNVCASQVRLPPIKSSSCAPGTDMPEMIAQLEREGVIDNPLRSTSALLVEDNRSKVKAGEYLFKQNASLRDVMERSSAASKSCTRSPFPKG